MPIRYSDLPANAKLAMTIWDVSPTGGKFSQGHAVPFGGTTMPLFDSGHQIQKGRHKCHIYRLQQADGGDNTTTPAFLDRPRVTLSSDPRLDSELAEIDRMERLFKQQEMGEISRVEWLDQLVFRGFEKKTSQVAKESLKELQFQQKVSATKSKTFSVDERPGPSRFVLHVELPMFDNPVVFADHEYLLPPISNLGPSIASSESNVQLRPVPNLQYGPGIGSSREQDAGRIIRVYDPELSQKDNPAETKHRRLVRSQHRNGLMDKDLKPNAMVRDEINSLLSHPPTHPLTPDNKDLIWKFRYHLAREKRALTKFVKSVAWEDPTEAKQATQLLGRWAAVDVDDALELLGPTFTNPAVRAFAVDRLRQADDTELQLYLLQLVQALKFEQAGSDLTQVATESSLAQLLIQRAAANFTLGNYFYWYLMVECDDTSPHQLQEYRTIYNKVAYNFVCELEKRPEGAVARSTLRRQAELVKILGKVANHIKTMNSTFSKKIEELKKQLADPDNSLIDFDPPLPIPLDPSIQITGISWNTEEVTVFKSSLCPIKVTFKTTSGKKYPIIFKEGDDLRQDQLCIQIITLMDQLLRKENLDLRLSPYKILATSTSAGASQFVESKSLQSIVHKYGKNSREPALTYLRQNNPDPRADLGVRKECIDTFVRSCAGYSVITYILGVGDRHLDNLLLSPDGHFFHADFGFILGRDPKPLAPMVKVSKEMVDAMGGMGSPHWNMFKQYCFLAYSALRKSSNLILNLFSLMTDANIPDIRLNPEQAVQRVKERLNLEVSEEEAIRILERIIEDSYNAIGAQVIDIVHGFYQGLRS